MPHDDELIAEADAAVTAVISRRQVFAVLGAPVAVATLGATPGFAQAPAAAPSANISLLLVNDIYKISGEGGRGGFPKLNAVVKAERARGVPMLYCHGGDCFSPSLMSGFDQGAHIVELHNVAPPDVFAPGNHEFDFGKDVYLRRMGESRFPYFAANMREADGSPIRGMRDNQIFDLGPIKVGVFGLALPNTPQVSSPGDYRFLPVMDTVRAQSRALREAGADLVVCVAHTDRADDLAIVRSRLVDVLLTGHDHDLALNFDGRTVMVESSEEGFYVTAVDLTCTIGQQDGRRRVTWMPAFRIYDSRTVTPDPETQVIATRLEGELSRQLDVEIGTTAVELDSRSASVRSQETVIGNLIADALRAATGAQVAITNGGGIRANKVYPAGARLTRRDVLSELPFGNSTIMVEITGADIKAALENGVSQVENRAGRFPQVSGLSFEFDPRRPAGQRVLAVRIGDQPLDETRRYTVASNNFMLAGGDGYSALGRGRTIIGDTDGRLMAQEVMVHIRRLGTVNQRVEGRIVARS